MFAKLLKHELKSSGGMLGLLNLAALAAGIIGGFLLRINMNVPTLMAENEGLYMLTLISLPVVSFSLLGFGFGAEIYLAVQFYKSKFTDRGYLTFTLPVHTWQIYLASLVNLMLWSLLTIVVICIAFFGLFFIGIYDTEAWHSLMQIDFGYEFEIALSEFEGFHPLYIIAEYVSSSVRLLTSITLGSVLAKKHKVLGSIGAYYCISMVIGALNTWISGTILYDAEPQLQQILLPSAILSVIVILGGSALSIYLMDRKLNLP